MTFASLSNLTTFQQGHNEEKPRVCTGHIDIEQTSPETEALSVWYLRRLQQDKYDVFVRSIFPQIFSSSPVEGLSFG